LAYARADFSELTGLPAEGLDRPAGNFAAPLPLVTLEASIEQAERQSPLVKAAEHQAKAAGADIDRYGLAGRPVVEGVAGYQGQYRLGGEGAMASFPTASSRRRPGCVSPFRSMPVGRSVRNGKPAPTPSRPSAPGCRAAGCSSSGAAGLACRIDRRAPHSCPEHRKPVGRLAAGCGQYRARGRHPHAG
jgi:hypothetical protein